MLRSLWSDGQVKDDRILLTPDGVAMRRTSEGIGFGTFKEVKEGQPLREGAELIRVGDENEDGWRDVTSIYKSGPPQVATPRYRENYDKIFGKQKVGMA
jgi:hypothetical protein